MAWTLQIASLLATVTDPTVPPSVPAAGEAVTDPTAAPVPGDQGVAAGAVDVVGTIIDNLGNNGYQTGIALVAATAAVIAMLNLAVHRAIVVPVAVGAFWAGWLGWNTLAGQANPLFPGDVSTTKLWDIALAGDTGFLIVASVACVAAFFLWRKGVTLASRLWLLLGAVLGASFVYHLVEAVRVA